MKNLKHTPGPWTLCQPTSQTIGIKNARGGLVAEVWTPSNEALPTANLISASPDLLEAVQRLIAELDDLRIRVGLLPEKSEAIQYGLKALMKVDGEQQ